MGKTILKIENVSKIFEDANNHFVLDGINFSVKEGEFVCILGPSGCGKTVLLYLIAGFLEASEGKILLDGSSIDGPGTDRMMVFQEYVLFPWKSVYDNVLFGLEKSSLNSKEQSYLVNKYLDLVGLADFKNWYIHKLSGGMQQRVAIARALISDPKVLLMDEPFSALDSQYRKFMQKNLENIWRKTGKTIIFVTHAIGEALYLADTIHLFSCLPTKIKKSYVINSPRPRDKRSKELIEIARDIDKLISEDFGKKVDGDFIDEKDIHKALNKVI